ncbi:MAG: hypothetical protein ACFFEE_12450, partial [Candidatus Thorarchaeota archaeon]
GCIEGCLRYLNHQISTGWLYGGTGHAFVLNIANELCPSGPTAWKPLMLFQMANHLGFEIKGIFSNKTEADFPKEQERAWNFVKKSIDNETPCYGWELEIPEFYVIKGYDDIGYYISGAGCDDGKGPIKWQDVGLSGIGIIEMYSIQRVSESEPEAVVKEALQKVLHHSTNPKEWIFENYSSGIPGFNKWIEAVNDGTANSMGLAYNSAVWTECRKFALVFLEETRQKLSGELHSHIDESLHYYQEVFTNLNRVVELFPFSIGMSSDPIGTSSKSEEAVEYLTNARNSEEKGLESLKQIVEALEIREEK